MGSCHIMMENQKLIKVVSLFIRGLGPRPPKSSFRKNARFINIKAKKNDIVLSLIDAHHIFL
jgi:hypothetical protein